MAQNNIVNDTASLIPDVVREAFTSAQSLSVRDVLLLESADVTFFATGAPPSFRDLVVVYWLITDRPAFQAAVESGDFRNHFANWAETVTPAVFMRAVSSVSDVLVRTFRPMEGTGKKSQKEGTPKP